MHARVAAFALALAWVLSWTAGAVTIVADPGPFASVEEAAHAEGQVDWWDGSLVDDSACTECFAAVELRRHLAKCLGVPEEDIPLAGARDDASDEVVVVVRSMDSAPDVSQRPPEGPGAFCIRVEQKGAQRVYFITGRDRAGALYGAYRFLERLGVRFFGLGELGTVYPATAPEFPVDLDLAERPGFYTRGFWAWEDRGNEDFLLWMARNGLNLWTAAQKEVHFCKKLGLRLTLGGHDPQERFLSPRSEYPYNHPLFDGDDTKPDDPYAPPAEAEYHGDADGDGRLTNFEAHPEWYGLRGGKRSDRLTWTGDNFCTSNSDAVRELTKNFVQSLIDGVWHHTDVVNFWMLDCGTWCECDRCTALGTPTDRLLLLIHQVRGAIDEAREQARLTRNVQLVSLAYHETLPPPTRPVPADFDYTNCYITYFPIARTYTHALADPASTEVNVPHRRSYEGWVMGENRHYQGDLCIGEYYNVSSIKSLPVVYTRMMSIDIPWYFRTGARHFHYMHTPTRLWGTWTLNQYLMARLLWDPEADADAIVDEYFERYYPTATQEARRFYDHLERATANIKAYKHNIAGYALRNALNQRASNLFPKDTLHYEKHTPLLNDGIDVVEMMAELDRSRQALDATLLAARNSDEQLRLLEDEARFSYGEAMLRFFYHMVRVTMFHNEGSEALARREFESVERFAEKLRSVKELCLVASSHANASDGLEASQIVQAYEFMREQYGEPAPSN